MKSYLSIMLLFLCAPLFVCCDDDDDDVFFKSNPKADIEFQGESLATVQQVLAGCWYLVKHGENQYTFDNSPEFILIKSEEIKIIDSMNGRTGKWYKIEWFEVAQPETGETMHAFFPRYDNLESMNYIPYVPYRIKDNVLEIGDGSASEIRYYALMK